MARKKQDPAWYARYYAENRESILAQKAEHYSLNSERIKATVKVYREANKEFIEAKRLFEYDPIKEAEQSRKFRSNHPGAHTAYRKKRMAEDPSFKLTVHLRSRLRHAIKNNSKKGSAVKLLGCTVDELRIYLESKFITGMSWSNWSFRGWHVDHIKPLASFDLTDPIQLAEACHYTNLQPLWWRENIQKGDSLPMAA